MKQIFLFACLVAFLSACGEGGSVIGKKDLLADIGVELSIQERTAILDYLAQLPYDDEGKIAEVKKIKEHVIRYKRDFPNVVSVEELSKSCKEDSLKVFSDDKSIYRKVANGPGTAQYMSKGFQNCINLNRAICYQE